MAGNIDNELHQALSYLLSTHNHGLRTPNEALFSLKFQTFWVFWVFFGQNISTHFGAVSPLFIFSIILEKLSLYIHISNNCLGLGFEYGI